MRFTFELCVFFLGTGKNTTFAAVSGDVGWQPAFVKQWKSSYIQWNRMCYIDYPRINIRVFVWTDFKALTGCKNDNLPLKRSLENLT